MVFILCDGRCYEAEICSILLLLICVLAWDHFFAKVKIFSYPTPAYRHSCCMAYCTTQEEDKRRKVCETISASPELYQAVLLYKVSLPLTPSHPHTLPAAAGAVQHPGSLEVSWSLCG